MSDNKERGLYGKFNVRRTDGRDTQGEKHFECGYFVLDLVHDRFALLAILAYANACRKEYPKLAEDLDVNAGVMESRFREEDRLKRGEEILDSLEELHE